MNPRLAMLAFTSLVLAISTTSCSTVNGFGQDVKSAGRGIQRAANN